MGCQCGCPVALPPCKYVPGFKPVKMFYKVGSTFSLVGRVILSEVRRRKSEDGSPKTEDGSQKTEVRRWKSEDGSQKTEDGSQKTEVRRRKSEDGSQKFLRKLHLSTKAALCRPIAFIRIFYIPSTKLLICTFFRLRSSDLFKTNSNPIVAEP